MGTRTARRQRRALVAALAAGATLGAAATAEAAFPGGNGKIVYVVNLGAGNGGFEIFTANPDGSDATNLTNSATNENGPDWSPDGTKIAFHRNSPNGVYIMNADGSGAAIVPNTGAAAGTVGSVTWSPDGQRLAHVAAIGGGLVQIQLIDADGTDADFIGPGSGAMNGLEWSPDGQKLVFSSSHDTGDPNQTEIYTINVDDTGLTRLTNDDSADDSPDWRPDGSKILWTDNGALTAMNPNGTSPAVVPVTGPTVFQAAYSPDGTRIAYGNAFNVRTANVDGTGDVAGAAGNTRQHDWQPTAQVALPAISVDDPSVVEGDAGTVDMVFTVTRSGSLSQTSGFSYDTSSISADFFDDYALSSGFRTFGVGESTVTVAIPVKGDTLVEGNETFRLNIFDPVNATIADNAGIGTIIDDDAPPSGNTTFSVADVRQAEGDSPGKTIGTRDMIFTIRRSGPLNVTSTVRYATANSSARAPGDFIAKSGQIKFEPGKRTRTIRIKIKADNVREGNEVFGFVLSRPTGATLADGRATGTILNDD